MFKNPFSFNGRIPRTEYVISLIIYMLIIVVYGGVLGASSDPYISSDSEKDTAEIIFLILLIPLLWFLWAQGAKRCHDMGNSGWWQLMPFFILWLIFAESQPGTNEYGVNPKRKEEDMEFSFEKKDPNDPFQSEKA